VRTSFVNALLRTEAGSGFNKARIKNILDDVFSEGVWASEVDKHLLQGFLSNPSIANGAFQEVMKKYRPVFEKSMYTKQTLDDGKLVVDVESEEEQNDAKHRFFFDENQELSLQKMQAWVAQLPIKGEGLGNSEVLEEVGEDIQSLRAFLSENADWSDILKNKIIEATEKYHQEE